MRKVKEGETTNDIIAFLTTEPNVMLKTIHPKAMPERRARPVPCPPRTSETLQQSSQTTRSLLTQGPCLPRRHHAVPPDHVFGLRRDLSPDSLKASPGRPGRGWRRWRRRRAKTIGLPARDASGWRS